MWELKISNMMSQFNVGEDNAKHDPEISEWV